MSRWRQQCHRYSTRLYGPSRRVTWLSWIADQRIAIGCLPTATALAQLPVHGVTHIVNCRSTAQTWISQDLAVERDLLGPEQVVHAPMWDHGHPQSPHLWSAAACFAAHVLTDNPTAGILVHCQQGRRRSIMLTYAVLRLRGHSPEQATTLITSHRPEAELVSTYTASVECWLDTGAKPVGPLRTGTPTHRQAST